MSNIWLISFKQSIQTFWSKSWSDTVLIEYAKLIARQ